MAILLNLNGRLEDESRRLADAIRRLAAGDLSISLPEATNPATREIAEAVAELRKRLEERANDRTALVDGLATMTRQHTAGWIEEHGPHAREKSRDYRRDRRRQT